MKLYQMGLGRKSVRWDPKWRDEMGLGEKVVR